MESRDESLLIELEAEFLISLWKILKRYVKLLKFGHFLKMQDSKKTLTLVNIDCFEFLMLLKDLDNEFKKLKA